MSDNNDTSASKPADVIDNNKRDAINRCVALKEMPHVYEKLKKAWGYPEFFTVVDGMLLMEPGREGRAGFSDEAHREIDALKRIFMKFPDEVMPKFLDGESRQQVKDIINNVSVRINYNDHQRR